MAFSSSGNVATYTWGSEHGGHPCSITGVCRGTYDLKVISTGVNHEGQNANDNQRERGCVRQRLHQ
jgi:hypothetical protein